MAVCGGYLFLFLLIPWKHSKQLLTRWTEWHFNYLGYRSLNGFQVFPNSFCMFILECTPKPIENHRAATLVDEGFLAKSLAKGSRQCRPLNTKPRPILGIILGILILRPLKGGVIVNHGSTLLSPKPIRKPSDRNLNPKPRKDPFEEQQWSLWVLFTLNP